MLRFDIPQVWSNVIRWEAFVTWLLCLVALFVTPWVFVILALQGAVKGFIGHYRCPSHLLWRRMFEALGWQGRKEDAGKVLFVVSGIALALFLSGSALWKVPCIALLIFSFLEWAASFCAACWVYGAWYRRFPPSGRAGPRPR